MFGEPIDLNARVERAPSLVQRIVARLRFDSLQLSQAGVRSAAAPERQLLFEAGENEVHLQVTSSGERWVVHGQVLGPCGGGRAEMRGPEGKLEVKLNEICEFDLPPVGKGRYAIGLRSATC